METVEHCAPSIGSLPVFYFNSKELPQISKKHRRRALLNAASPEREAKGFDGGQEDAEKDEDIRYYENKDDDDEDEDEEEDFQPSEGSENEMETEMLDYI